MLKDETIKQNEQLIEACLTNDTKGVKQWIKKADVSYAQYEALSWSLKNNNAEHVRMVLGVTGFKDFKDILHVIIRFLLTSTQIVSLELMKTVVDYVKNMSSEVNGQSAVLFFIAGEAVKEGKFSVVQYLLRECDPKTDDSRLLQLAATFGHHDIIDLLYPLSDPQKAVAALINFQQTSLTGPKIASGIAILYEKIAQDQLHNRLSQAVDSTSNTVVHQRKL